MNGTRRWLGQVFGQLWGWLRELSGEALYDHYVECCQRCGRSPGLTRKEFYLEFWQRRSQTFGRCC